MEWLECNRCKKRFFTTDELTFHTCIEKIIDELECSERFMELVSSRFSPGKVNGRTSEVSSFSLEGNKH